MSSKDRHDRWMLDVISALRFQDADTEGLRLLAEADWTWLLNEADRCHISLPLAVRCRSLFPEGARQRLDDSLASNAKCHSRVVSAYREIAAAFQERDIGFLVLKGLAQWPWYVDDSRHRVQTDIDIYCLPESLESARQVLVQLGYEPVHASRAQPVDHLPVMIRKTGWTWRGDYYDPDRPPSVELHFRFWDSATEGFTAGNLESFRDRRVTREICGIPIPGLHPLDGLKYSAMHLIRHLLRGDLQIRHVYELAHFLERSAGNDAFWNEWRQPGSTQEHLVESMAFRLCSDWFGCRIHPVPRGVMEAIPVSIDRWFQLFGFSPARSITSPNKDELWLHMSLVASPAQRRQIAIRRLFPTHRQRVILDPHVQAGQNAFLPMRRAGYELAFLAKRAIHHFRTLLPVLKSGFRWWRATATSV